MSPETPNITAFKADDFYAQLGFPDASLLDRRIFKRMVLEHGELTASDKRTLSDDVGKLTWKYTLKASTVQVLPYEDAEREYLEVAVVEALLGSRSRATRIAEMIQRAIPYPVLLVMVEGNSVCVSVAHKRFSQAEKGSIVAEDLLLSPWIEGPLSDLDHAFCDALAMSRLSQVDFFALYRAMSKAVLARTCAEITGRFVLDSQHSERNRLECLEKCARVRREILSLGAAIRREERFAERVGMSMRITELKANLSTLEAEI